LTTWGPRRAPVGPEHVVEDAAADRVHDRVDARDGHRRALFAESESLGEVDEPGEMVEMRARHDRVLDRQLLGHGQCAGDAASVEENLVVDEERRGSMSESFAAEGAEYPNLHRLAILAYVVR
jgi:hypothetical protein